ncbi:unnamed protein product [Arctogadus glacialis]
MLMFLYVVECTWVFVHLVPVQLVCPGQTVLWGVGANALAVWWVQGPGCGVGPGARMCAVCGGGASGLAVGRGQGPGYEVGRGCRLWGGVVGPLARLCGVVGPVARLWGGARPQVCLALLSVELTRFQPGN